MPTLYYVIVPFCGPQGVEIWTFCIFHHLDDREVWKGGWGGRAPRLRNT